MTHKAVPAILTGNKTKSGKLPTYQDAPNNLMSLLGTELPVHRYRGRLGHVPQREVCAPPPRQPLSQALRTRPSSTGTECSRRTHAARSPASTSRGASTSSDDPNDGQIVVDLEEDGFELVGR